MAIGVESADLSYTGNGATVSFPVSFTFENASEVKVYANAVLVTSGITISPGAVVFATAPASGVKIRILRETPLDQPRPFSDPQKVSLAEFGNAMDRLVRQVQEQEATGNDQEARALRVAFGDSITELPTKPNRASRYLGFDSNGNPVAGPLTAESVAESASSSASAASASAAAAATSATAAAASASGITAMLSTTGGASKVPQYTLEGNLVTGAFANDGTLAGNGGNVYIPDVRAIRWFKKDGTLSSFSIMAWQDHDANGGELLIQSPFRTALIQPGAFQLGDNSSGRRAFYLHLVSGAAISTRQIRHSPALSFQTRTHDGTSETVRRFMFQAVPTDNTNGTVIIRGFHNATVSEEDTNPSSYTDAAGLVTGDLNFELGPQGLWHRGTNPTITSLTDATTITWTLSRFHTEQLARVSLGGNRTLQISGAVAGMRGRLLVTQDSTGSRSLTLPAGSRTPSGGNGVITLTSTANAVDLLEWLFDGTYFYWQITANLTAALDTNAQAYLTAASISDATITAAINNLAIALKTNALWDKFDAIYPFAGGTSTAHAQDLKNNYPITWTGTITHNANGITGDGSTGWGNTGVNLNTIGSRRDNCHLYVYCRTTSPNTGHLCGATDASSFRLGLYPTGATNIGVTGLNFNSIGSQAASAASDFRKHFAVQRISGTTQELYVNGIRLSNALSSTGTCTQPIAILARKTTTTADTFSNANLAFATFGQQLTETEWTTFRTIVDNFQTALGRKNP